MFDSKLAHPGQSHRTVHVCEHVSMLFVPDMETRFVVSRIVRVSNDFRRQLRTDAAEQAQTE